ncbi:MAG: sulfatase-like hydrolase/transferase [Myxococcota bacterium]|nr:sulfatase-like hydrolase/transferase [Myxococcota bacterium]
MNILLEILGVAIAALLIGRLARDPWRGWLFNFLKVFLTFEMVRLLLVMPFDDGTGTRAPAWQLILDQLNSIDATVFWTFAAIGAFIRFLGVLASMYRWQLVLRGQRIELPFRHILGAFLIGRAIGFFLPSTAGLDGYKLYDASRLSGRTVEVTAGTVLEKVLGVTGIFLTYLIALPFGMSIFGENAVLIASITVPLALGVIVILLTILWFPGLVQWTIENIPLPAKNRIQGVVTRISHATAAYRDKKGLVLMMLLMSFFVHFFTAAMYFFMAIAVGASLELAFWPVVFGSSIQIFATVIGPTIGGIGIREAAQVLTLGSLLGLGVAAISATLGFWVGEVPTLFGFVFWLIRGKDYRPAYCRVDGVQVDYEEAAKQAVELETDADIARREAEGGGGPPPLPQPQRLFAATGLGLGIGILAGIVIGLVETLVIAQGGFGNEAQVLWYGPLAYAVILGGLGAVGGACLSVLPLSREEAQSWVPALGLTATLIPFGLAITIFRLRRDVYLEQMPPISVLLGVLAAAGVLALIFLTVGRRFFGSRAGVIARPLPALGILAGVMGLGAALASAIGAPELPRGDGQIPASLAGRPNVVLVMVDTLRADHLSCYGGPVPTPNLCQLAEDGGSRYQGFSHASWTKPATASLLTSLLPSTHRAMSKPSKLSPDVEMIAEVMQGAGYTTGGIVSNINLADSFGFNQGYDEYYFLGPAYLAGAEESSSKLIIYNIVRAVWFNLSGGGIRPADFYQDSTTVNEVAFEWLDRNSRERFFLFLHYMDPHDPYFRHPYDGYGIARVSNPHPDAALAEEMHTLYKGEIEFLDANFGRFLDRLRADGVYDNTVIALVSDHGEEFFEHGGWWHGLTLYEEQIHVPLLIKWAKRSPGPAADAHEPIARLIDVAPTLAAVAGAEIPAAMQGTDLRTPAASRNAKQREVYSEEDHEGNVLWSLRTETRKLIAANEGNPRGLATQEFFAIDADPNELNPLDQASRSQEVAELEQHADLHLKGAEGEAVAGGGEAEMSYEECEQLRMLGYVDDCESLK